MLEKKKKQPACTHLGLSEESSQKFQIKHDLLFMILSLSFWPYKILVIMPSKVLRRFLCGLKLLN